MKGWAIHRIAELEESAAGTGGDEDDDGLAITIAHDVSAAKFDTALGDVEKLPCKFIHVVRLIDAIPSLSFIIFVLERRRHHLRTVIESPRPGD